MAAMNDTLPRTSRHYHALPGGGDGHFRHVTERDEGYTTLMSQVKKNARVRAKFIYRIIISSLSNDFYDFTNKTYIHIIEEYRKLVEPKLVLVAYISDSS